MQLHILNNFQINIYISLKLDINTMPPLETCLKILIYISLKLDINFTRIFRRVSVVSFTFH